MSSKVEMDAPRLWLVLSRCHRALNQIAERSIEEAGLCLTDFAALEALLHKGPLTITQIQSKVPLALGSMTAAVDRLEKKGLIMRTPASGDRRVKVLKLTPEGKRTVEKAFSRHAAELESAMAVERERKASAPRSSENVGTICGRRWSGNKPNRRRIQVIQARRSEAMPRRS